MRSVSSIKWTEKSIHHINRHNIKPEEVQQVCFNEEEKPFIRTGRDYVHYVFGKTIRGRYLFVVIKFLRRGQAEIITARDMNIWKKDYFKRRGK